MSRTLDAFAGVSWVTSAALLVQGSLEADLMNWAVKGVVAGALAITAYFFREAAKTLKETKDKTEENARTLSQHDAIIGLWIESLGKELDAREGHIGRRKTDHSMANLITAIRGVQDRNGDKE